MNAFVTQWLGFVNANMGNIDGDDTLSAIGAVNNMLYALKINGDAIAAATSAVLTAIPTKT